jgi:SSS family solute:Na+ symporter
LIVKFGALIFILLLPSQYAIQLQLLGGIWIIQTLPAVLIGAYTRWLNPWAQLIGWAVGIGSGTWMAAVMNFNGTFPLQLAGWTFPGYSALYSLVLNLVVSVVLTPVFNRVSKSPEDQTAPADYQA